MSACAVCGYEFDHELLGKYGCPNCIGEPMNTPRFDDARKDPNFHGVSHIEVEGQGELMIRLAAAKEFDPRLSFPMAFGARPGLVDFIIPDKKLVMTVSIEDAEVIRDALNHAIEAAKK